MFVRDTRQIHSLKVRERERERERVENYMKKKTHSGDCKPRTPIPPPPPFRFCQKSVVFGTGW